MILDFLVGGSALTIIGGLSDYFYARSMRGLRAAISETIEALALCADIDAEVDQERYDRGGACPAFPDT